MVTFSLHGIGVSGGIAIGRAQLVSHATLEVAHYAIPPSKVGSEIARFETAVAEVQRELEALHGAMTGDDLPGEFGAFLDVHWMILNDATLSEAPKRIIAEQRCNAEWALHQQMNVLVDQFDEIEDPYLRERRSDVVQVVERVLKRLMGKPGALPPPSAEEQTILVAHDLSPADVIQFKSHRYGAFLTDLGGVTSHTAIVARSLNVPAVVATHNARQLIRDGELLIVDGNHNVVIVNPDRAILAEYRLKQSELELERQKLKRLRLKPAETIDGIHVELYANIELPEDLEPAVEAGANGVGLFRSEFLFLNRPGLPSEDEQFEAYRRVAEGMGGKPVVIRTFDLGADKAKEGLDGLARVAPNPALGLRAVRFCLAEPRLFHTQLRAILRASAVGPVAVMFPMIATLDEWRVARRWVEEERAAAGAAPIPVGIVVEVAAAALLADHFAREVDFLSIGTNDLAQYTLAMDRGHPRLASQVDGLHPAVLRLVARTIEAAHAHGKPVSVCGGIASDPQAVPILIGLGADQLSVPVPVIAPVKAQIRRLSRGECEALARRALEADTAAEVRALVPAADA